MGVRTAAGLMLGASVVVLAACGSCSSSSAGSSEDAGAEATVEAGPSPTQACTQFATALCASIESCTPFALQVSYGDTSTCVERVTLACTPAFMVTGTQATPAQMESCAAAVQAETCDEAMDNPQPSACNVPGSVPLTGACGSDAQCQSGYCKPTSGSLCGTCAAHVGAGSACTVDADCSATLVCNNATCIGPLPVGSACSSTQPCLRDLTCIASKCATPLTLGQACAAATDCDGKHGLYCDTKKKVCAQTQVAAAGQPCGIVSGNLTACGGGASCANISSTTGQGTCHPPASDGAPCGPSISCMPPAVCTSPARCTLPNPSVCH